MANIELNNLTKVYPDGTTAVQGVDLTIEDGELMVFVGPSGCGKTTALRMIAGLEEISGGEVSIGGTVVNDLEAMDRDIAMVFQNYALYPHMTVFDNLAFALKLRRTKRKDIEARVESASRLLELDGLLKRKPSALSGGQRQRVAMGRAIVRRPRAFLMDEPLSNLDAKLRIQMRVEISRLQRELAVTTIYVTHDQGEAMTLGDRIAVMRDGFLQQTDTPQRLYSRPANIFVAEFIGSPAMNLVRGRLESDGAGLVAGFGGHRLRVPADLAADRAALRDFVGKPVVIGIRPEDIEDAALVGGQAGEDLLDAAIDSREDLGSEVLLYTRVQGNRVVSADVEAAAEGVRGLWQGKADDGGGGVVPWVVRAGRETRLGSGDSAALRVDVSRLHFFDPETGHAIYGNEATGAPTELSGISAGEGDPR